MMNEKKTTMRNFAARIAKKLQLKPHESHEMKLNVAPGKLTIKIGKADHPHDPVARTLIVMGSIYLSGIQYEIHIQDKLGLGKLSSDDHAKLFDRSAQVFLHNEHAAEVYQSLVPFIEMGVEYSLEEEDL